MEMNNKKQKQGKYQGEEGNETAEQVEGFWKLL